MLGVFPSYPPPFGFVDEFLKDSNRHCCFVFQYCSIYDICFFWPSNLCAFAQGWEKIEGASGCCHGQVEGETEAVTWIRHVEKWCAVVWRSLSCGMFKEMS